MANIVGITQRSLRDAFWHATIRRNWATAVLLYSDVSGASSAVRHDGLEKIGSVDY